MAAAVALVVLAALFRAVLSPHVVLFANDGPLGVLQSAALKLPDGYSGMWMDLNWLGAQGGHAAVGVTYLMLWVLGAVGFAKFYVPLSLVCLSACACFFFRQLRFGLAVCILGGLAAALNSNFFSNACWGLASRGLSLAAAFLALAAIQRSFCSRAVLPNLVRTTLAGLAIGLAVVEGGDNGAIFSLFIAAFAFYGSLIQDGPLVGRVVQGAIRVGLMTVFAAVLAAQTMAMFIGKDVKGTSVASSTSGMSKERQWAWATQWSLPKLESFRVLVPGLFGYRLDTPGGGDYWGGVGQEPGWEEGHSDAEWVKAHPGAFPRHSGAGEYAGVAVVLIAIWALAHSFIAAGAYSRKERLLIWFWGGAALLALVLSWGRHAPFYQFIYALPYFSTIRNPMKFMHPFHMALMILFAYGLQGLWRRYLEPGGSIVARLHGATAPAFEKKTRLVLSLLLGAAVLAWLIFASSQPALARYLSDQLAFEPASATAIARFSAGEVGWSVFFLILVAGLLLLIMRGAFTGGRGRWAGVALGVVLVLDLGRANMPWIKSYDYQAKYATNGVLAALANTPYLHRVSMPPLQWDRNYAVFQQIYAVEWLQHQFQYYNIQSLDVSQEPRMPADKAAYREALATNVVRLWELTNTRFLCGMAGNFVDVLNQQFDPVQKRFRLYLRFSFFQDSATGNIGARVDENGPFALIEFTGALPRAQLYRRWQAKVEDTTALATLASPGFNSHQEVLVAEAVSLPSPTGNPANAPEDTAGSVEFVHYAPKHIILKASPAAASILLLNDRYDPNWVVTVDGQPASLLRCNFTMRGVELAPGLHTAEFHYRPPSQLFYVSFGAVLLGLVLCVVCWRMRPEAESAPGANG